jgi:hypothetical protein
MYEDFDEEYDEDDFDKDHPSLNPYQWYYKFDVGSDTPFSKWIQDVLNDLNFSITNIPGFPIKKFPVSSYFSNTGKDKTFQYLGNNYQGNPIWKKKYFLHDKHHSEYIAHLSQYTEHFLKQPHYYKGMFDIMN